MNRIPKTYIDNTVTTDSIKALAADYDDVFVLDSCSVSDSRGIGRYQILIGLGEIAKLEFAVSEVIDWERVDQFIIENPWVFFVVSYDCKNQIHGLSSNNRDFMQWPLLTLVAAQTVVGLNTQNELMIWADNADEIRSQLLNVGDKPQVDNSSVDGMSSSMDKGEYLEKVRAIKHEIELGNVYEMNLCVEYTLGNFKLGSSLSMFNSLTQYSPVPFAAFVKTKNRHIMCASPERFLAKRDDNLYSQPIKGTSSRFDDDESDKRSRDVLMTSEKERAEHIMIVDLVRNDLAKNSVAGTTEVEELFGIYSFAQVHQMISTVKSRLKSGMNWSKIIRNTFPMGSMTGAPKHIAMEFIDAMENASRGWYSGSVGYIDPDGDFDCNVVIRSILYDSRRSKGSFSVGGAITYDSDPDAEFEECQLKASAIRKVFGI